jgi:hypothetical protein
MQGLPSGVKTLGQAQMNRDNSVGTLSPANQSMASCKVNATKKQCLHIQDAQDLQFVTELCVSDDGVITDEDVAHFFESDIEDTVTFTYQPGSEVPKTRFDRQQDITEFGGLLQVLATANPAGITPALIQTIISKAAEYKNLDGIDPGNAEMDKELAERRFEIIEQNLNEALHQQLQIAQAPQMLAQNVLAQALSNPILFPLPLENHTIATEYWRDKAIQEMKKEMPDLMLIQACQVMIQRHSQGTFRQDRRKSPRLFRSSSRHPICRQPRKSRPKRPRHRPELLKTPKLKTRAAKAGDGNPASARGPAFPDGIETRRR